MDKTEVPEIGSQMYGKENCFYKGVKATGAERIIFASNGIGAMRQQYANK